ncbi:MAG: RidA family protein [Candidatus Omnitrophica bacterium]|nr:RidA family protein [Candidatus Omnitrophota bacterium]
MSKKIIRTNNAPQPIGPYNQAVQIGNLIYTSGQIPLDAAGQISVTTVPEQTRLVITHLKNILEAAGSSLSKVVKATVFLKDMNDFAQMNQVYTEFFSPTENAPARSTIQVARLPKDALVEIEVVAEA